MEKKQLTGRRPEGKRTVINIVERSGGKRKHFHSFTIRVAPIDVMRALQQLYRDEIRQCRDKQA